MRYEIKALDTHQSVVSVMLHALDMDDARRQAKSQGYAVLSVRPRRAWMSFSMGSASFDILLFFQELQSLLGAGLPLMDAMEALSEKESGTTNAVLTQIIRDLYEGQTLSQSMARLPAAFPDLLVALIRASERTGDLPEALKRYIAYRTQVDRVRKMILSASLYPALLILVGTLVMVFLMVYVVPRFSLIYADLGENLPLMSRLLMSWGILLHVHGMQVGAILLCIVVLATYGFSRPRVRRTLGNQLWRIPAAGRRMHTYQLARFYRTLGMLQRGGIPLVQAITMAESLLPAALRTHLSRAGQSIREGWSLSRALETHGLATPIALRLIAVGERSGQLGDMLEQVAQFHDEELTRWVDGFLKLFEPLLMAFIGILIGTIVVLMYMPVFELAGSLQ
jgi:general secretion pathway protein F